MNWPWIPPSTRIRRSRWPQRRRAAWARPGYPAALSFAARLAQSAVGWAAVPVSWDDVPKLAASAAEAGDEAELSMVFSAAACPVGPAAAEAALPATCVASEAPPPASTAASASPAAHHAARPRRRGGRAGPAGRPERHGRP